MWTTGAFLFFFVLFIGRVCQGDEDVPPYSTCFRYLSQYMDMLEEKQTAWERQQQLSAERNQQQHEQELQNLKKYFEGEMHTVREESAQLKKQLQELKEWIRGQGKDDSKEMDQVENRLPNPEKKLEKSAAVLRKEYEEDMSQGRTVFSEIENGKQNATELDERKGNNSQTVPWRLERSDDIGPLEPVIGQITQRITEMTSDIQALKNANQQQDLAQGTAYIRWGHTSCPASAQLVYTGLVAGTHHRAEGGGANHLCLTSHPVVDDHPLPTGNGHGTIYGSEYDICPEAACQTTPACAVCHVSRAASVMIPGTNQCATGWTKEYSGYIMSNYDHYTGSSEYICVDSSRERYSGSDQNDNNENILYYITAKCGALPCPPYADDKVVPCVVCSK